MVMYNVQSNKTRMGENTSESCSPTFVHLLGGELGGVGEGVVGAGVSQVVRQVLNGALKESRGKGA